MTWRYACRAGQNLLAEKSPKLKNKGILARRFAFHIYVTDDQADIDKRVADGFLRSQMVLTNRRQCNEVSGCDNSKSFWAFEGLPKIRAAVKDKRGNIIVNKRQLAMKFMPCFCPACQENEEILLSEQELGQIIEGPRQQCPFYDDIASSVLPVRPPAPADGSRAPTHVYYGQKGICTTLPHVTVPDEALYLYIAPTYNNGKYNSTLTNDLLNMQMRCRGLTLGNNQHEKIDRLLEWLKKKGMLPDDVAAPIQDGNPVQA